ncbi:MAG: hypothetical protein BWK75_00195 [Candidatus Altiarchaeales archaeon A3]|nr:MAG: hypothetical protein BWK75_00195 [Candidatus Altiarchaeales archaeon A3]
MSGETKKTDEIIDGNIESSLEETPYGIKKNLKVNCNIKFKNFKVRAGKIRLKFPVELAQKAVIEKTTEGEKAISEEIFKGGEVIELKNVCLKECGLTIDIPQLIQEIISSKVKQ